MNALRFRRGFTLIELLVTMGLIILLLSIAVAVSNSATMDSYKIVGAGDKLSQALINAKARAARDKSPRGVRIVVNPATGLGNELYFIEQPEPFLPDQDFTYSGTVAYQPIRSYMALKYPQVVPTPPPGTFPKPLPTNCRVYLVLSPGDYARVPTSGTLSSPDVQAGFVFKSFIPAAGALDNVPAGFTTVQLDVTSIINPDLSAGQTPSATPVRATFQTPSFGIYPPARPLAGEPSLILSKDVAVDMTASLPAQTVLPMANGVDLMFSPSGHVMYSNEPLIAFILRDTKKLVPIAPAVAGRTWLNDSSSGQPNFQRAGEMTIVAVYPKAGTIFTKPVAEPNAPNFDPFLFCRDAINNNGL